MKVIEAEEDYQMKKNLLVVLLMAVVLVVSGCSGGGAYPEKDITFIIPFGTGGGTDIAGRFFIAAIDEQIEDVNMIPKNVPGPAGSTGAKELYNSDPDGYTFLIAPAAYPVANITGKLEYTYEDYTQVAQFAKSNMALFVQADSPYNTVDDLVAAAKAQPGELKFGASMGTLLHFATLGFEEHYDIEFAKVAIGGATPMAPELQSGRIVGFIAAVGVGKPLVDSGDFRALAVYGDERNGALPDVQTFTELGSPYSFTQNLGVWAPKDTPQEIIDLIAEAAEKACAEEGFVSNMSNVGQKVSYLNGPDYTEVLKGAFADSEAVSYLYD